MTQHSTSVPREKSPSPISKDARYKEDERTSETTSRDESEDDGEWVDDDGQDSASGPFLKTNMGQSTNPIPDASINIRSAPRRRPVGKRTTRKDTPMASPRKNARPVERQKLPDNQYVVIGGIRIGCKHVFEYVLSLGEIFFRSVRVPLAYTMVLVALWVVVGYMVGYATDAFVRAIQPTCSIPGISSLPFCNPSIPAVVGPQNMTPKWADYTKLVDVQSKSFEQLLEESAGGSSLSLEIKKVEMATADLVARVRVSDLNARDTLARSLSEFIEDAKRTGQGLQKLTSKVGGAVDNIMAVNDYALQAIETSRAEESSRWKNLIPWRAPSKKRINDVVMRTFDEAMTALSVNMERLIIEAELNLHNLNDLEERLATLHETIAREDSSVLSAKADLLESLWTTLGGNKKSLRNFDYHLMLLKGLANYKKEALAHVIAALQTLRAMSEDMEDMRERVAAPNLIGETVPVEVHIKSIQMGLDRLREGRIRAKKLEEDAVRKVLLVDN